MATGWVLETSKDDNDTLISTVNEEMAITDSSTGSTSVRHKHENGWCTARAMYMDAHDEYVHDVVHCRCCCCCCCGCWWWCWG